MTPVPAIVPSKQAVWLKPLALAAAVVIAALVLGPLWLSPAAEAPVGPLATTRGVLEKTHTIVLGGGDHNRKLDELKQLLRGFLDTDALGRKAMGKHLDGKSAAQVQEFLKSFRELFVRTYVQRLLLFDVPDFDYGAEKISGDEATVETAIVTPRDRFAVEYRMKRGGEGWRATDILVEGVSLAENFRAQFDSALARDSFEALLERLRRKLGEKPNPAGL